MTSKVSKENNQGHYYWGDGCEGWNFVKENDFSIKQERMPAGTSEILHLHETAQQFFFILSGEARFEMEDTAVELSAGEGVHVRAGMKHSILNNGSLDLDFIFYSQPATENDRINCHDE
jgi:mannose-6-phosphate isomerase-like protein (cupin superfamily)